VGLGVAWGVVGLGWGVQRGVGLVVTGVVRGVRRVGIVGLWVEAMTVAGRRLVVVGWRG